MELHSYAKRKSSKKWTIEQKRKLVESRIAYDGIFSKKRSNCLTTWRKIVALANLDDYNVLFVRRQWSNMVAKYKQYKHTRLGDVSTNSIDDETLCKVSQEWEFFYPIHCFMSRKITNLHSYALKQGQKVKQASSAAAQQQELQENDNHSQLETMLGYNTCPTPEKKIEINGAACSSDTNGDYAAAETVSSELQNIEDPAVQSPSHSEQPAKEIAPKEKISNTDHDFYSRKSEGQEDPFLKDKSDQEEKETPIKCEEPLNHSEQTEEDGNNAREEQTGTKTMRKASNVQSSHEKSDKSEIEWNASPGFEGRIGISYRHQSRRPKSPMRGTSIKRSERDKYYRHKRRFNRRIEDRFDSLLNVFGQIVRAEYPSVDVRPLMRTGSRTRSSKQEAGEQYVNGTRAHRVAFDDSDSSDCDAVDDAEAKTDDSPGESSADESLY